MLDLLEVGGGLGLLAAIAGARALLGVLDLGPIPRAALYGVILAGVGYAADALGAVVGHAEAEREAKLLIVDEPPRRFRRNVRRGPDSVVPSPQLPSQEVVAEVKPETPVIKANEAEHSVEVEGIPIKVAPLNAGHVDPAPLDRQPTPQVVASPAIGPKHIAVSSLAISESPQPPSSPVIPKDAKQPPTLYVCVKCRYAINETLPVPPTDPGDIEDCGRPFTSGRMLMQKVCGRRDELVDEQRLQGNDAQADRLAGLNIEAVDCLSTCYRSVAVAFSCPGRYTYQFGDIDPTKPVDPILDFAEVYLTAPNGFSKNKTRPQGMRDNILARVPPMKLN